MKRIIINFTCYMKGHKWTCKASQNIKPEIDESFSHYAKMWCSRCGKESDLNIKSNLMDVIRRELNLK